MIARNILNKEGVMLRKALFSLYIAIFAIIVVLSDTALAAPMNRQHAEKVVRGWLKADAQPLRAILGQEVVNIETFSDIDGQAIYHVVYLQPSGFVIVPAEDGVEPIVGFSLGGTYDPSPANPLGAMVSRDLPGRMAAVRGQLPPQAMQAPGATC